MVLTAEEHQINGGLGESVAGLLSRRHPTKMDMVAVNDTFGESGTPAQLLKKYGINFEGVLSKARRLLENK